MARPSLTSVSLTVHGGTGDLRIGHCRCDRLTCLGCGSYMRLRWVNNARLRLVGGDWCPPTVYVATIPAARLVIQYRWGPAAVARAPA